MKLINLTPHPIHIREVADGDDLLVLPCEGNARVSCVTGDCLPVVTDGGLSLSVRQPVFGAVEGLPDPVYSPLHPGDRRLDNGAVVDEDGEVVAHEGPFAVGYIVSRLVLERVRSDRASGRTNADLFAPGELVRDASGRILACVGLSR